MQLQSKLRSHASKEAGRNAVPKAMAPASMRRATGSSLLRHGPSMAPGLPRQPLHVTNVASPEKVNETVRAMLL